MIVAGAPTSSDDGQVGAPYCGEARRGMTAHPPLESEKSTLGTAHEISHANRAEVTVVVVDDFVFDREGAVAALSQHRGIHVLGTASSLAEARVLAVRVAPALPQVVVTDLGLPDVDPANVVHDLCGDGGVWPNSLAVVRTRSEDAKTICAVLAQGAAAYIVKFDEDDLVEIVLRVAAGAPVATARMAGAILRASEVSERQREVLELITSGFSNLEIAERLNVSEKAVEKHIKNLRDFSGIDTIPGSAIRVKLANWYRDLARGRTQY
jgi:two-component system, NarL family, nitrate/nitrite response regulator NarL